ncbi:hypothetical protein CPB83DRAFT_847113 [Crepidotus variabilis]|uniref:Uncharacterized protein n=1 Tax=Crepidotus variabilis TaxID=179855 RepID=A0A9P6JUM8_9AGAR|nr:hypothetical protein CPB83DRAFT_847113 [Crepidotus variabilis]
MGRPENLLDWQRVMGLMDQPILFTTLRKSIADTLQDIIPPHVPTIGSQNLKGVQRATDKIVRLYPDLFEGATNKKRRNSIARLISRERVQRKTHWRRRRRRLENRQVEASKSRNPKPKPKRITGSRIGFIDLTISEDENDSDVSGEETRNGNSDGAEFDSQGIKLDPSMEREIVTRSRTRLNYAPTTIETSPPIEEDVTPAPIAGSSSKSGPRTPIPVNLDGSSLSLSDKKRAIRHFLEHCTPPMGRLCDQFWDLGVHSESDLRAIGRWSANQRRQFLEKLPAVEDGVVVTEFQLTVLEYYFVSI